MYYAEELCYADAQSRWDVLRRFETKAERDAFVESMHPDIHAYAWDIKAADARRQYDFDWYTRPDGTEVCGMRADYIKLNLL